MKRDTYTQARAVQDRLYDEIYALAADLRRDAALHRSDDMRATVARIATVRARFDRAGAAYNERRRINSDRARLAPHSGNLPR